MSREQEDRGASHFLREAEARRERDIEREERERERRQAQDDAARLRGAMLHDGIRDGAVEQLAALFDEETAHAFRGRWKQVQVTFQDDPRQSVQRADELMGELMRSLADNFARQRATIDAEGPGPASTDNLRMALRGYRSFFERLLAL